MRVELSEHRQSRRYHQVQVSEGLGRDLEVALVVVLSRDPDQFDHSSLTPPVPQAATLDPARDERLEDVERPLPLGL